MSAYKRIITPFYLLTGARLLLQPGVRIYALAPLLINALFFIVLIIFGIQQFNELLNSITPGIPEWLQWIEWLLWPLFIVCFVVSGFFLCLLLATMIASPFNDLLVEAVLRRLRPEAPVIESGLLSVIKGIGPGLLSEARKFRYFIVRAIPLALLFVIPGLNLLAPMLWLIFSAWMLALEYMEYPMSADGLLFADIRNLLARRRLSTFGFGAGILLLSLVPVINFFIMPIAVAGATALYVDTGLDDGDE